MSYLMETVKDQPRQEDVAPLDVTDHQQPVGCDPRMRIYKVVVWNVLGYMISSAMVLSISSDPWHYSLMRLAAMTGTLTVLYYLYDMSWDTLRQSGRLAWPLAVVRSGLWRLIVTVAVLMLAMAEGASGGHGSAWALTHAAVFTVLEAIHNRLWESLSVRLALQPMALRTGSHARETGS